MKRIPGPAVYATTTIIALVIVTLSLVPRLPGILHPFSFSDKIFHAAAYTVFSILLFFSLKTRFTALKWCAPLTLTLVLILGGLIEIIQPYFSRSKDIYDFLSDTAGGAGGIFLSKQCIRTFRLSFGKGGVFFGRGTPPQQDNRSL